MAIVYGNILDLAEQGAFNAIVHGCNCFCNFGAGLALQIKQRYPAAYKVDLQTIKGDKHKLGQVSVAAVTSTYKPDHSFLILNAYTQYNYGRSTVHADYKAIRKCFNYINTYFSNMELGVPMIGAGLAGGDWNIINAIIEEQLINIDYTIVKYKK
jgi:O-acetyl-ADP-ribose deacetylase (regulator of RNase III)